MANIKRANASGITKTGSAIPDVPDAPTIGSITDPGTDGYATVAFTPATTGGSVTTYTATSTPGSITGTSATSPITVTGLTLNTAYTFKVKGTNATATGPESAASSTFTPIGHVPNAPTIGTASANTVSSSAVVSFTPSGSGPAATSFTVTSSPGNITATGASSPIVISGLTNGTAYTFTVKANNASGSSLASAASNSFTPQPIQNSQTFTTSGTWTKPSTVNSVEVLVVAGGGPGGGWGEAGGGGGGGGVVYNASFAVNTNQTVTIGASRANPQLNNAQVSSSTWPNSYNGFTSSFGNISATGGGIGGYGTTADAGSGGSGGGGSANKPVYGCGGPGNGISGQGFGGGSVGRNNSFGDGHPAGGGGAGAVGGSTSGANSNTSHGNGGTGGAGATYFGTTYAGGGGGGQKFNDGNGGGGGSGGGGNGANYNSTANAQNGTNGLGGGGGGACCGITFYSRQGYPGSGGSGAVVVRWLS